MRSESETVDEYLDEIPPERALAVNELRKLFTEVLPVYSETMKYNMPTYTNGNRVFAMASQKQYISLYFDRANAVKDVVSTGMKCSAGKSCVRFTKAENIDMIKIKKIIVASYSYE